jgi:hypothetical protein
MKWREHTRDFSTLLPELLYYLSIFGSSSKYNSYVRSEVIRSLLEGARLNWLREIPTRNHVRRSTTLKIESLPIIPLHEVRFVSFYRDKKIRKERTPQ